MDPTFQSSVQIELFLSPPRFHILLLTFAGYLLDTHLRYTARKSGHAEPEHPVSREETRRDTTLYHHSWRLFFSPYRKKHFKSSIPESSPVQSPDIPPVKTIPSGSTQTGRPLPKGGNTEKHESTHRSGICEMFWREQPSMRCRATVLCVHQHILYTRTPALLTTMP